MKIAHVVTFASADGAFGGPTRVALGQAKALAQLGHDVTVFAGAPRSEAAEVIQDGYRLRTFPVRRLAPFGGFATMWPVGMRSAVRHAANEFDVAHLHLARDLATLPSALALLSAKVPYVVQAHGMIDHSARLSARALDFLATRSVLSGARCWLTLTKDESAALTELAVPQRTHRVVNGVEVGEIPPLNGRADIVLYLARLHERKRPLAFVEMAINLADRLPNATFLLIGPDEGEGDAVVTAIEASGLGERLRWAGPLPPAETAAAMGAARVYVLPAVNEVFPMTILEAFAAGTPVVTTSSLGIAPSCEHYGAAIVTDGTIQELSDAVFEAHEDQAKADALRGGAVEYLKRELDVTAVAADLVREYTRATEK